MEDEPIKETKTLIDKLKQWNRTKIKYAMKTKEYANPRLSLYYLSDTRPRCSKCQTPLQYQKDCITVNGKMYYCEKCKKRIIIT